MSRIDEEIDESLLTPAQKAELERSPISWKWIVFWGVLLLLIAICILVIVLP